MSKQVIDTEQVLLDVIKTRESLRQTAQKVEATRESIKESQKGINELDKRWVEFQDSFDRLNKGFVSVIQAHSGPRGSLMGTGSASVGAWNSLAPISEGKGARSAEVTDIDKSLERRIKSIADAIKSGEVKSVSFLTGAGCSVASGIPDFRSKGGMYDTLRPNLLTATKQQQSDMEMIASRVVSWDLFKENPIPYMEVRRPFIIGTQEKKWKMTIGHYFAKLLHDRKLLNRVYTQNIDGLDYQSGVPRSHIIPVHGSIGHCKCEFCGKDENMEYFVRQLKANTKDIYNIDPSAPKKSSPIMCRHCSKAGLKPSTVLYGRPLPSEFQSSTQADLPDSDLLLILGTSLTVYPAANIPNMVSKGCRRVLINRDPAGDFSSASCGKDDFWGGGIDLMVLKLIQALGWEEDLLENAHLLCESSRKLVEDSL